jgi:hypothetical protein
MSDNKDRVIFKITAKDKDYPETDCIAFLLDVESDIGCVECYQHVGQHGEASIEYYYKCTPATPEQYADLKAELEIIGYNVKVCKRWNRRAND